MRRLRASLPLPLLAALLAACGTVEEDRPERPSSFRDAANAICADMQRAAPTRGRRGRASMGRMFAAWERALDRLDALSAPPDDANRVARMVSHFRRMSRAGRALVRATDERALAYSVAMIVEGQRGSALAKRLGLPACVLVPPVRQPPPDREPIDEAAKALVPRGAKLLRPWTSACQRIDGNDSCLFLLDMRAVPPRSRVAQAKRLLTAHGWRDVRSGSTATGGSWVMGTRNDYAATYSFPGREREYCRGAVSAPGCTDTLWVHRVEVPQIGGVAPGLG